MILNMKASEAFKIFAKPYYDLFHIKKGLVDDYTLYIKYNTYEIICPLKFINQIKFYDECLIIEYQNNISTLVKYDDINSIGLDYKDFYKNNDTYEDFTVFEEFL